MEIIHLPGFWVGMAFVVVVAIVVFKARGAVLGGAYARIARVSTEIAYAEDLREEAQKILVKYEKQYRESLKEAKQITEYAREETKDIIKRITKSSDDVLLATTQRSKDSIERAKLEAIAEVRQVATDTALDVVALVAKQSLIGKVGDALVEQATKDITKMN